MKNLILILMILITSISFSRGQNREFIKNRGQITDVDGNTRSEILYQTTAGGVENYLQASAVSYVFSIVQPPPDDPMATTHHTSDILLRSDLYFIGTKDDGTVMEDAQTEGTINYYTNGNSITNCSGYEKVTYNNIYNNINLVLTNAGELTYEFYVNPGGNPADIKFNFDGVRTASLNMEGEVIAENLIGEIVLPRPVAFLNDGATEPNYLEAEFTSDEDGFGISTAVTDGIVIRIGGGPNPLTAMPTTFCFDYYRTWSTYYGGSMDDKADDLVMDAQGNAYVAGHTRSALFPTFLGIYMGPFDTWDAFVVVFKQNKARKFATYFGGHGYDEATAIAVASGGDIFFTGFTESTDFPHLIPTIGSVFNQPSYSGDQDAFISRLTPTGTLVWSTWCGATGMQWGHGLTIDNIDNIYMGGTADNHTGTLFPILNQPGAYNDATINGTFTGPWLYDGFILKFDINMVQQWGTFLGGDNGSESVTSIIHDANNNIYLVGSSSSTDFPIVTPAGSYSQAPGFTTPNTTNNDYLIVKFNAANVMEWSTYLGGTSTEITSWFTPNHSCAVDDLDNFYLTGRAGSSDFPMQTLAGAYNDNSFNGGSADAFICKFGAASNDLQWSTFYGGSGLDGGTAMAYNTTLHELYITGNTQSANFPLVTLSNSYNQATIGGAQDAFLMKLDAAGAIDWSTFLGGNSNDVGYGIAYYDQTTTSAGIRFAGAAVSTNFPVRFFPGAYNQLTNAGLNKLDMYIGAIEQGCVYILGYRVSTQQNNSKDVLSKNAQVILYPNPSSGIISIAIINGKAESGTFEVYNALGKKISSEQINGNNVIYDTSTHPKGLYLLKVTVGNEIITKEAIFD